MPTSYPAFHSKIAAWIAEHPAGRYLDIGAGDGKYGQWVRQSVPGARIEAIEIDPDWIAFYNLRTIYDEVYCVDAGEWFDSRPDLFWDIVFIGDTIEHMRKSAGTDLIHHLIYRCQWMLLTFPCRYLQYSWYGHAHEAHRSAWDESDFMLFEHEFKSFPHDGQVDNWVIVKGWR